MISSQKDSFFESYKEGKNFIPIVETWPADLETPLSTWLKLSSKDSHGVSVSYTHLTLPTKA